MAINFATCVESSGSCVTAPSFRRSTLSGRIMVVLSSPLRPFHQMVSMLTAGIGKRVESVEVARRTTSHGSCDVKYLDALDCGACSACFGSASSFFEGAVLISDMDHVAICFIEAFGQK